MGAVCLVPAPAITELALATELPSPVLAYAPVVTEQESETEPLADMEPEPNTEPQAPAPASAPASAQPPSHQGEPATEEPAPVPVLVLVAAAPVAAPPIEGSMKELRQRARDAGASNEQLEDVADSDDPKGAVVELIRALETTAAEAEPTAAPVPDLGLRFNSFDSMAPVSATAVTEQEPSAPGATEHEPEMEPPATAPATAEAPSYQGELQTDDQSVPAVYRGVTGRRSDPTLRRCGECTRCRIGATCFGQPAPVGRAGGV